MKAIMLAAGKGSRISKDIGDIPKSTLPLENGEPIVRRNVQMLLGQGIEPILCVGYKKEYIYEALQGLPVKYYNNPFFEVTNNIASLWFAREEFAQDDVLVMSADLYFPKQLLDKMAASAMDIALLVDKNRLDDGDFYLEWKDRRIVSYGPDIPREKRKGENVGFTKLAATFAPRFCRRLEEYIDKGWYNQYFENLIFSFSQEDGVPVDFVDTGEAFWREFDFYDDYKAILAYREKMAADKERE